jgi:hypothetical protein
MDKADFIRRLQVGFNNATAAPKQTEAELKKQQEAEEKKKKQQGKTE